MGLMFNFCRLIARTTPYLYCRPQGELNCVFGLEARVLKQSFVYNFNFMVSIVIPRWTMKETLACMSPFTSGGFKGGLKYVLAHDNQIECVYYPSHFIITTAGKLDIPCIKRTTCK